ncbi:PREDICTED: 28S ribosomal protein S5, mitochondrial-like isoform X2 [Priapulus caudatus]|uniref:Small ribosomal subunit protein uS5m n=1 Tax=Priapulus caudatus TaxID=37621 RepID=A0ABM1DS26_PRICU|nr:PREDICTED: 28S ribosomal protein S5, mitochondrial-like isoform X2 [Priapulus caudatus]
MATNIMVTPWRAAASKVSCVFSQVRADSCHVMLSPAWSARVTVIPTTRGGPLCAIHRQYSFMTNLTANALWKGVTSVSAAGKKRGRGKKIHSKSVKDLNRGQRLGTGRANIVWPGLNAPVFRGKEIVEMRQLPPDPDREAELIRIRDAMDKFRPVKIPPIERGWTGAKMPGRSVGPPDPVGDEKFEGFDTKVLEFKTVFTMSANLGRKRRVSAFVVVGNGNGLAGYGLGKSPNGKAAIRKAKNRAAQKLQFVELYKNHTIYHDIFTQFFYTKVFLKRKPEGYGLVCHRAIRTICEVIGIKDMYAKVEGATNVQNITKALLTGLTQQETHEQLAERMKLLVVEQREERDDLPVVIAEPSQVRDKIAADEEHDYDMIHSKGRVELIKPKSLPFYAKFDSYKKKMKRLAAFRNQRQRQIQIWASQQQ